MTQKLKAGTLFSSAVWSVLRRFFLAEAASMMVLTFGAGI